MFTLTVIHHFLWLIWTNSDFCNVIGSKRVPSFSTVEELSLYSMTPCGVFMTTSRFQQNSVISSHMLQRYSAHSFKCTRKSNFSNHPRNMDDVVCFKGNGGSASGGGRPDSRWCMFLVHRLTLPSVLDPCQFRGCEATFKTDEDDNWIGRKENFWAVHNTQNEGRNQTWTVRPFRFIVNERINAKTDAIICLSPIVQLIYCYLQFRCSLHVGPVKGIREYWNTYSRTNLFNVVAASYFVFLLSEHWLPNRSQKNQ